MLTWELEARLSHTPSINVQEGKDINLLSEYFLRVFFGPNDALGTGDAAVEKATKQIPALVLPWLVCTSMHDRCKTCWVLLIATKKESRVRGRKVTQGMLWFSGDEKEGREGVLERSWGWAWQEEGAARVKWEVGVRGGHAGFTERQQGGQCDWISMKESGDMRRGQEATVKYIFKKYQYQ